MQWNLIWIFISGLRISQLLGAEIIFTCIFITCPRVPLSIDYQQDILLTGSFYIHRSTLNRIIKLSERFFSACYLIHLYWSRRKRRNYLSFYLLHHITLQLRKPIRQQLLGGQFDLLSALGVTSFIFSLPS